MLAPDKENPPETAGFKDAQAGGGVQGNDGNCKQATAVVLSELAAPPYPDKIGDKPNKAGGYVFELDIERMNQSDTWAIADARQRPLLLMLWTVSWTQVPCGTLPDNDAVIAVRIGLPVQEFKANRDVLMRGWWKASNGRLYHPVITEQVIGVMERKAKAAARQRGFRERQGGGKPGPGDESIGGNPDGDGEVTRYSGAADDAVTGNSTVSYSPTTTTTTTTKTNTTRESRESARPPRGSRLPNSWIPSDEDLTYARKRGIDADREAEKFRNHWMSKSGNDAIRANWSATWKNWILNAEDYQKRNRGDPPKPSAGTGFNTYKQRNSHDEHQRQRGESLADYSARINRMHDERDAVLGLL